MKKMSRRDTILYLLKNPDKKMTCHQITKYIIKKEKLVDNVARYLSGSISSKLQELVKTGQIIILKNEKGERGGKVYQKNWLYVPPTK